jgi:hypothetical protein
MEDLEIVNMTFKMHVSDIEEFEPWFSNYYQVIDFKHFADRPRMRKEDKTYRKMLKQKKLLTDAIEIYRNKNNHKYLENE